MIIYPPLWVESLRNIFMNELPKDIGGYQHIESGPTQHGDIWVSEGKPQLFVNTKEYPRADGYWPFKQNVSWSIYRKVPVPSSRDNKVAWGENNGGDVNYRPLEMTVDNLQKAAQKIMESTRDKKALTHDDGKLQLATLPPAGLRGVAAVQLYGHKKYGDFYNYRLGMEHSRQISCALRHLLAHMDGETNDPESGLPHLAHATCRIMFLMQNVADKKDIDDRYVKQ